jgi:preprotein translocase subunit SecG
MLCVHSTNRNVMFVRNSENSQPLLQVCFISNWSELVQIGLNLFSFGISETKMKKMTMILQFVWFVIGLNLSKLVETCPNWSKLVQIGLNLFFFRISEMRMKKMTMIPKFVWFVIGLNLSKLVETCPNLSKLVQIGLNLLYFEFQRRGWRRRWWFLSWWFKQADPKVV